MSTSNGAVLSPLLPTASAEELPFLELGTSGLKAHGGFIKEEFLQQLSGPRGMRVYREMRDNDSMVGAALFAVEMAMRRADWSLTPADASTQALFIADRLSEMLFQDMSTSWSALLVEILSFLTYGWAYTELVYKRRTGYAPPLGQERDPTFAASRFTDGLIGLRKLPLLGQDTLLRWEFTSDKRGLVGMVQQDTSAYQGSVLIPIDKALLFRPSSWKGNPEGRSILRNAYRSWYMKTRLENLQGIGIERNLVGIPKLELPAELFGSSLTAQQAAQFAAFKTLGKNVSQNEQSCILWPLAYDDKGNKRYDFSLVSLSGNRPLDTSTPIERYDTRILQSILADIVMVGQGSNGSQSLAETKSEFFLLALTGFLDVIAETFTLHCFPRLADLNGWPRALTPTLVHSDLQETDFERFSAGVKNLAQAGLVLQPSDEAYIRAQAGFPELMEETL